MNTTPTRTVQGLGLAGLLPFVGGAIALHALPVADRAGVSTALLAYGATIVAFLGGMHWGLAARGSQSSAQVIWGVIPSLVAWGALLAPAPMGLAILAAALVACYVVDRRVFPAQDLAGWMPLRATLTIVAAGSCLAGAVAMR